MTAQVTTPEKLINLFWNLTEKEWQEIDPTILSIKTVQTIDENTRVKLVVCFSPFHDYFSFYFL